MVAPLSTIERERKRVAEQQAAIGQFVAGRSISDVSSDRGWPRWKTEAILRSAMIELSRIATELQATLSGAE